MAKFDLVKFDINNPNVKEAEVTVAEIRAMDSDLTEKMEGWLDEAQGAVFGGTYDHYYLVIKVTN
jgi:hypothetical protein